MLSLNRVSLFRQKSVVAAFAAAMALTGATRASAHGGFARAFQVLNQPTNPKLFIIRSDVWGLFYSTDAGQSWNWSCAEPFQSNSLSANHNQMDLVGTGRLIVASGFNGIFYTDTFCDWSQSTGLDNELVVDVKNAGGNDVMVLTSTGGGANGGISNQLWISTDKGASFKVTSSSLPTDVVLSNFAIAPSDPKVIYVVGQVLQGTKGVGFRSADGGKTFARFDAPSLEDAPRVTLRIAAIHPTNPDVVFEWLDQPEGLGETLPDEQHFTTDGGKTWHKLFVGQGDMPGLAISPDNKTLAVSGAVDGVYSGKLDDVLKAADGSTALTQVNPRPVWGLLWNETGLYGGNNNFANRGVAEDYTLGLSKDSGASFSEIVNICQMQYPTCATGTQVRELCDFLWESPAKDAGGFKQDFWVNSGRCPDQVDGGTSSSGGATSSGGGPSSSGATGNAGGSGGSGGATGATGGSAGSQGAGGSSNDNGGTGSAGTPAKKSDDGGCALGAPSSSTPSGGLLALGMSAIGLAFFRRVRQKRSSTPRG
jgi:hypothetical protein